MYVFTLHLKGCDHIEIKFSRYGFHISYIDPYNFLVAALGHSSNWPLNTILNIMGL